METNVEVVSINGVETVAEEVDARTMTGKFKNL